MVPCSGRVLPSTLGPPRCPRHLPQPPWLQGPAARQFHKFSPPCPSMRHTLHPQPSSSVAKLSRHPLGCFEVFGGVSSRTNPDVCDRNTHDRLIRKERYPPTLPSILKPLLACSHRPSMAILPTRCIVLKDSLLSFTARWRCQFRGAMFQVQCDRNVNTARTVFPGSGEGGIKCLAPRCLTESNQRRVR